MKLVAPDKNLVAVDVKSANGSKKEMRVSKDGTYRVNDRALANKLKSEGFISANLMGSSTSRLGYDCKKCGFGSWFSICSRCGNDNA